MVLVAVLRRGAPLLAIATMACGSEPHSQPIDRLAAIHASCTEIATAWCESHALCQYATFVNAYGDQGTCVTRQTELCKGTRFGAGVEATPEDVRRCARALDLSSLELDARCAVWLKRERTREAPPECVFTGTLAEGARCVDGSQCMNGSCRPESHCGRCRSLAENGEQCFEDGDCKRGLACLEKESVCGAMTCTPNTRRCMALAGLGNHCEQSASCQPGSYCQAGKCAARVADGGKCSARGSCALWPVELECNQVSGKCEPIAIHAYREPCGELPSGRSATCAYGLACRPVDHAAPPGLCLSRVGDGLSCGYLGPFPHGGPCMPPAVCADGECQIPSSAACTEPAP